MRKILEGVHVLEMCVAAAGPSCGRMLVDMGAEDIMVEPLGGQSTRFTAPRSYDFKCGGKKSIPINLKSDEGREMFIKLVKWADVFVSNFRTKALVKLGFAYEDLKKINPKIVYGTVTGFGKLGPQKDDAGFDATAWWAKSGLMVDAAQRGTVIQIPYATGDFSTGQSLCIGICAALFNRERTGEGCEVTSSLMGSGIFLNYDAIVESQYGYKLPITRKESIRPLLNTYQCGDGEWVSINATHHWDTTWPFMCKFMDRMDLVDKYTCNEDTMRENAPFLIELLDAAFAKHTQQEAYDLMKTSQGISCEKIQHSIDVISDPQAVENQFVVPWTDRDGKKIMHPVTPLRVGDYEAPAMPFGPLYGEHTEEIMTMLGYTQEQIKDLHEKKVVEMLGDPMKKQ